jgi:hypothetical protein
VFFKEVWTRLQIEFDEGDFKDFHLLQMLMRCLANIVILTQDQSTVLGQIIDAQIIQRLVKILAEIPIDILKNQSLKFKRNFTAFFTHTLRFFIVCQSVDRRSLDQIQEF